MSERRGNRKRKSKITDEDEDSDFEDNNIKATRISTLSAEDHVCAQYILASLQKHKYADPFRHPVDTTVYFDYLDFVKQPMDFSTVQDKLNKHMYSYLDQFASEVRLIFSNCWAYNQPGSQVYNQASVLSQSFEKHLKKMRNQLKKVRDPEIEEMEQHIDQLRSEHDSLVRELQKLAKQHKRQTGNSTLNSNKKHSNRSQTASPISGSITHNINNNNNSNNNVSTPITSKKSREAINSTIHNNGNEINNSNNNNNNNSNNTVTTPTQTSIKNNKLLLYEQTSDEYGYKDKERLSNKINRLSPDNQQKLLEVLANELPEDKDKNGGEVELDLNSLNDEILKKLELFVNEVLKQQEPTTIQVDSIINKEPDTDSSDSEEEEEDKKEDHDENPQII